MIDLTNVFTAQERSRINTALIALWEALDNSGREISIEKRRTYAIALAHLGVEQIEIACLQAMQQCQYFPRPVELIELVAGTLEQRAAIAWDKLYAAIYEVGAYKSVEFDDPVISRCVQNCGGWQAVCEKQVTWLKKDFMQAYKTFATNGLSKPVRLTGIHDQKNNRYRPVLIGNKQPKIETKPVDEVKKLANMKRIAGIQT